MQKLSKQFRLKYLFRKMSSATRVMVVIASLFAQFSVPIIGDISADVASLVPNGVGNYDQWTANTGTKIDAVAANDGDATYINETDKDGAQTFTMPGAGVPSGSIVSSVVLSVVAKRQVSTPNIYLIVEKGKKPADINKGSLYSLTNNYATYNRVMTTNPFTGKPWTVSDVNNWTTKFGVLMPDACSIRVTQISVVVNYTPPVQPVSNPPLTQSCGLDIALVLDSSGSIDNTELAQMKSAFQGFVSTFLPATPTQFSVIDFDSTAKIKQTFTDDETLINSAINSVSSDGSTNWEDGLIKAQSTLPNRDNPNLIIFASDGNPNRYGNNQGSYNGFDQASLNAAVVVANDIKNSGTRIITLGIGSDLNASNLEKISSADAVYTSDFETLASDLEAIASQLCGGTITVTKVVDQNPASGWNFDIGGTIKTTGDDGKTEAVKLDNGTYSVTETQQAAYSLVNAFCDGATDNGTLSGSTISGIQIGNEDIVSCVFYNATLPECTEDADCNDDLFCNGEESCVEGSCVSGDQIDCSGNDISEILTCENSPDDISFTWDSRNLFNSSCDEGTDTCTTGNDEIDHECSVENCQAQCDATHSCSDTICHTQNGCVGNDYYTYTDVANTCESDCNCTDNSCGEPSISYNDPACTECQTDEDCNKLDKTYCDGAVIKQDEGKCVDYSCTADTADVLNCDNGLACDGVESCSGGNCVSGTAVDCSNHNIFGIASCTNNPDNNPFSWDFRNEFISECQDPTGTCTTGNDVIEHSCDAQCGGCTSDADCNDQNQYTADTCNSNTCQCEHSSLCEKVIVVSNTDDDVFDKQDTSLGKAALTWVHSAWTSVAGSDWIWRTVQVENPMQDETYLFVKDFYVSGTISSATLKLAADNTYKVWINDSSVGENSGEHNYEATVQYDVFDKLHSGVNTIKFEVMNMGQEGGTWETNPAGVLYRLEIERSSCEEPECIEEGGSGAVVPNGPTCCTGLTSIGCSGPIGEGYGGCSDCVGAFYCTYCGNGICGLGENKCNCPEDCTPECENGETQSCTTGLPGICTVGTKTCADNTWGECVQNNPSILEICDNGLDDDCDGYTDEGCEPPPVCDEGDTQACETSGSGICGEGIQACTENAWGTCTQVNEPTTEICGNEIDEDCSGADLSCPPSGPFCGDGSCNNGENSSTCCHDCGGCGGGPTPPSTPYCGDGLCNNDETCSTCVQDCGGCGGPSAYCGDGIVNGSEQCDGTAGVSEGYTCNSSCALEQNICKMDLNAMIVMDVSGSMGYENPTRLYLAKIAANSFVNNLRNEDQSGLVSFSWTASLNKKLSNDHASTKSFIDGLASGGATNIGDALNLANQELISAGNSASVAKIEIFLTDGRANKPNGNGSTENPADLALALNRSVEAGENGIRMFTIGLGSDVNTIMLQTMADNTGGKYYYAPTGNELSGIFNQIAAENCKSSSSVEYVKPSIVIFNSRIVAASATSATVSWYTNIPATSRVVYDTVSRDGMGEAPNYGYAYSTAEDANKVVFHSVTITGLNPGTNYYWRPISHGSPEVQGDELIFSTKVSNEEVSGSETEGSTQETGGVVETQGNQQNQGGTQENEGQVPAEGEAAFNNNQGFLAAIGNILNLGGNICWVLFFVALILIVLAMLSILNKRRVDMRNWIYLGVIVILAILNKMISCTNNSWILLLGMVVLVVLMLLFKKKKGGSEISTNSNPAK